MMLNVEEMSLMRMFQAPAKETAIRDIQRTIVVVEDEALRDALIQLSEKLRRMAAEEYARLDIDVDDEVDMDENSEIDEIHDMTQNFNNHDDLDIYKEDEAYGK